MDCNFPPTVAPAVWPEIPQNANRQQYQQPWQFDAFHHQAIWGREEDNTNFMTPENSLLSYDSSANSGTSDLSFYIAPFSPKRPIQQKFAFNCIMVLTSIGTRLQK